MRGKAVGGTHGGSRRHEKHISGKPWSKYHNNPRGGDRVR